MAAPVLGPPPAHSGLPKCQLRVSLPPGSLAEASGEKLEPEDVFILNSVGPHHAKNTSLQLRYFPWQKKSQAKKREPTTSTELDKGLAAPPPPPAPSPPEHTWGRGGGGLH